MREELKTSIETLVAVEESLERANREGDLAALKEILSDDFAYTGGMGGSQSKAEWLSGLPARRGSPEAKKRELETAQRSAEKNRGTVLLLTGLRVGESTDYGIEMHGDIAIANQRYALEDPDGSARCLRYVRVYRKTGDRWQLVSHRYIHAID